LTQSRWRDVESSRPRARPAPGRCRRAGSLSAAGRLMAKGSTTKVFFATDLHGSSKCFRKFINAGPVYGADVLVLGADLAGKAIQSIVPSQNGRWRCTFIGTNHDVAEGQELTDLEKLIEDHGYYPYRGEPGELAARRAAGT